MIEVTLVSSPDEAIESLLDRALTSLQSQRGGIEMRRDIEALCGAGDARGIARALTRTESLLAARRDDRMVGVAALSRLSVATVMGVYVDEDARRHGVGLALVRAARDVCGARDGWASPGDRATKSLYEAAGWKARLLTMSDGEG